MQFAINKQRGNVWYKTSNNLSDLRKHSQSYHFSKGIYSSPERPQLLCVVNNSILLLVHIHDLTSSPEQILPGSPQQT